MKKINIKKRLEKYLTEVHKEDVEEELWSLFVELKGIAERFKKENRWDEFVKIFINDKGLEKIFNKTKRKLSDGLKILKIKKSVLDFLAFVICFSSENDKPTDMISEIEIELGRRWREYNKVWKEMYPDR